MMTTKTEINANLLFPLIFIPLLIFGIFVNWWLAIIIGYFSFGFLIWIEGHVKKKEIHFIVSWLYLIFYRLYEDWKDDRLMKEWGKTDEERLNEKRYKTLKKIL